MRDIMKHFAKERKNIRRIAHERHPRYYEGMSFAETYDAQLNNIMEPILEALSSHTNHYKTDILRDHDNIRAKLNDEIEENSMFYAIGVRECGTDSDSEIETWMQMETDINRRYFSIFWFFATIDTDSTTGEPIRYIDVYRLINE